MLILHSCASQFIKGLVLHRSPCITTFWDSPGPAAEYFCLSKKFQPFFMPHSSKESISRSTAVPAFVWLLHVWPLLENNTAKRLKFTFRYHPCPCFVLKLWALAYFSLTLLFPLCLLWQQKGNTCCENESWFLGPNFLLCSRMRCSKMMRFWFSFIRFNPQHMSFSP